MEKGVKDQLLEKLLVHIAEPDGDVELAICALTVLYGYIRAQDKLKQLLRKLALALAVQNFYQDRLEFGLVARKNVQHKDERIVKINLLLRHLLQPLVLNLVGRQVKLSADVHE